VSFIDGKCISYRCSIGLFGMNKYIPLDRTSNGDSKYINICIVSIENAHYDFKFTMSYFLYCF
jgi:hypothetical protein